MLAIVPGISEDDAANCASFLSSLDFQTTEDTAILDQGNGAVDVDTYDQYSFKEEAWIRRTFLGERIEVALATVTSVHIFASNIAADRETVERWDFVTENRVRVTFNDVFLEVGLEGRVTVERDRGVDGLVQDRKVLRSA